MWHGTRPGPGPFRSVPPLLALFYSHFIIIFTRPKRRRRRRSRSRSSSSMSSMSSTTSSSTHKKYFYATFLWFPSGCDSSSGMGTKKLLRHTVRSDSVSDSHSPGPSHLLHLVSIKRHFSFMWRLISHYVCHVRLFLFSLESGSRMPPSQSASQPEPHPEPVPGSQLKLENFATAWGWRLVVLTAAFCVFRSREWMGCVRSLVSLHQSLISFIFSENNHFGQHMWPSRVSHVLAAGMGWNGVDFGRGRSSGRGSGVRVRAWQRAWKMRMVQKTPPCNYQMDWAPSFRGCVWLALLRLG